MKAKCKYLVVDIDGTMTDGGIYYDENGNEMKKFCVKDAVGFFAARHSGMQIIVVTGRECSATTKRMHELNADVLYQNVKDKKVFLSKYMNDNGITKESVAYIGDDLNDLAAMSLVGYIACPFDSCPEIKEIADYISPIKGGYGAVRDVVEHILKESGEWDNYVAKTYLV